MWVLLGAIAITSWQFIESFDQRIIDNYCLSLNSLMCVTAGYLLFGLCFNAQCVKDDIRYSVKSHVSIDASMFMLMSSSFIFFPSLVALLSKNYSFGAVILTIVGLILFSIPLQSIYSIFSEKKAANKFPEPNFGESESSDAAMTMVFFAIFVGIIVEQIFFLMKDYSLIDKKFIKSIALLCAIYWLILISLDKKRRSNSISWTYDLEAKVFAGAISPMSALRRIENGALGPRLQDVMGNYFLDFEGKISKLDVEFNKCREKLDEIRSIACSTSIDVTPLVEAASELTRKLIKELLDDSKEFSGYIERLKKKKILLDKPAADALLQSISDQNDICCGKVKDIKLEFEDALRNCHSKRGGNVAKRAAFEVVDGLEK